MNMKDLKNGDKKNVLSREDRFYDTAARCYNCNHKLLDGDNDPYCGLDNMTVNDDYWCNMHD